MSNNVILRASRNPDDPSTSNGHKYFAPNFSDLVITLDGKPIENKTVMRADSIDGTLDVFVYDEAGNNKMRAHRKPLTQRLEGVVNITGVIQGCSGCAKGRMRRTMWWSQ